MKGDTRNTSSTDAGGNAVTTRWQTIDSRDGGGGGGDARHELRRRALHFGRGRVALGGGVGSTDGGASRLRHFLMVGRSLRLDMPCRRRQYGRRTRAPCACGAGRPAELDSVAMRCARVAASLAILLLGCERPVDRCPPSYTIKDVLPVLMYFSSFSSRLVHDAGLHALGVCRDVRGALCSFCSLPLFCLLFRAPGELETTFSDQQKDSKWTYTHASCGILNPWVGNTRANLRASCSRNTNRPTKHT